jgi:hypothetical protein
MEIRQIMRQLKELFPEDILDQYPLPSPWCESRDAVRAILLGCDPSNKHDKLLPYVFALGADIPRFNAFKNNFEKNLVAVGLSWETVYVQNLCRNYFLKETSKNKKVWNEAAKYWIPVLKEELQKFRPEIPVLLTSDVLFDVLVVKESNPAVTVDFYECRQPIPIRSEDNLLERPLIPFYRGMNGRTKQSYRLASGKWEGYRKRIEELCKPD